MNLSKLQIESNLKTGWCMFRYFKQVSNANTTDKRVEPEQLEIRYAIGTLNDKLFIYEKKTDRQSPEHLVTYWDYEAQNFRSFKTERFIEFIQIDINPNDIKNESQETTIADNII
jgi:hypothetical protein